MDNPKITYYSDGKIRSEQYFLNNKFHREDGPALIFYDKDGSICSEYYYLNGKCHRENGPAFISYYKNGKIQYENYFLNDVLYANSNSETFQQDLKEYHSMVRLKYFW